MDLELFIHGVPNGQKIYGISEEKTYFTTFYNVSKKEFQGAPKFLIEIRNLNETNYCYYSFLNYNNVSACDGRSGSYFGMTIRLNEFCNDPYRVFGLLYVLYRKYVAGVLFDIDTNKFLVSEFKKEHIQPIEKSLNELFTKCFSSKDFINIQDEVFKNQGEFTINWSDFTSINIGDCISKGRVLVATDYPSAEGKQIIAEWKDKLAAEQYLTQRQLKDKEEELTNISKDKEALTTQIVQQNDLIDKVKEQLYSAEKQNSSLQEKLDETRNSLKSILQNLGDEEKPLSNLHFPKKNLNGECTSTPISSNDEVADNATSHTGHRKEKRNLYTLLFLILIVIICCLCDVFDKEPVKSDEEIKALKEMQCILEQKKDSLQRDLCKIYKLIQEEYKGKDIIVIKGLEKGKNKELKKKENLKVGKLYTARITDFPYPGEWEYSENIEVSSKNLTELKFKANETGTVTIAYKLGKEIIVQKTLGQE